MSLLIKDIPKQERPRERLLECGPENLSNEELIAIVLKTGTKNISAKELALRILKETKDINELSTINKEKLLKIKGIGEAKAVELLATIELGKRIFTKKNTLKITYRTAEEIYNENKSIFYNLKQEYFYVLYLDNKNKLIERKLLFMGTLNRSIVHPREIFKNAYLLSASGIVCMHNHPSGDVTPSYDDIYLTNSLVEIGKLQAIPVIDHLIFGDNTYYSFKEHKKI